MNKKIRACKTELDLLLAENPLETDWGGEAEKLLVKIKFFQHERIVHLIVTMTMSLLTVITICALFVSGETAIPVILLFTLFLTLTAAYLIHYYKLENGVQELYGYYSQLREKSKNS
ncbi:MAG: hypothetical protein FWH08_04610 [Oscillospiraceae bacterium]|nr:hypothetical protein [Oscillospiraceae bacterium]